jgi:hypothetical protein
MKQEAAQLGMRRFDRDNVLSRPLPQGGFRLVRTRGPAYTSLYTHAPTLMIDAGQWIHLAAVGYCRKVRFTATLGAVMKNSNLALRRSRTTRRIAGRAQKDYMRGLHQVQQKLDHNAAPSITTAGGNR